jgi:hypothetical protein
MRLVVAAVKVQPGMLQAKGCTPVWMRAWRTRLPLVVAV